MNPTRPASVLWWDDANPATPAPGGDAISDLLHTMGREADVVIVGAGFTGLWTAYHLLERSPSRRVVLLEAQRVGYGASGRNGGWCTPELPLSLDAVDQRHGPGSARRWRQALVDTVDDIRDVTRREGLDVAWADGGWLQWCRNTAQQRRVQEAVAMSRRHGFDDRALRWMEPDEAAQVAHATRVVGASFSAQTAVLDPMRLVTGLAEAVRRRGGVIVEHCPVEQLHAHGVTVAGRQLSAPWVVRATEGFTSRLPGHRRQVLPVYSMMIATEPLSDDQWDTIGFADRAVFNDARHTVIYGQRTADGRLAFGGRGAPYHYGSRISARFDVHEATRRHLTATLVDLFPALAGVRVTHHWGGPLAVPRDWHPFVGVDHRHGWAWAGGYVGEGVVGSALAGRTLADLLTDHRSLVTELPWVGHRSRRWEPEPLRWLGVEAMVQIARLADRREDRNRSLPRPLDALYGALTGH